MPATSTSPPVARKRMSPTSPCPSATTSARTSSPPPAMEIDPRVLVSGPDSLTRPVLKPPASVRSPSVLIAAFTFSESEIAVIETAPDDVISESTSKLLKFRTLISTGKLPSRLAPAVTLRDPAPVRFVGSLVSTERSVLRSTTWVIIDLLESNTLVSVPNARVRTSPFSTPDENSVSGFFVENVNGPSSCR